ncbi:hypothetical protein CTI14_42625, partial [Methylobacterium radiotolerans]
MSYACWYSGCPLCQGISRFCVSSRQPGVQQGLQAGAAQVSHPFDGAAQAAGDAFQHRPSARDQGSGEFRPNA